MLFLITALSPNQTKLVWTLGRLESVIKKRYLSAAVGLFWHGVHGAKTPSIPHEYSSIFRSASIDVEKDFDSEESKVA
jgi:hypothetical protein